MAHIQNKPVHDSEAQQKKNFQAVDAKSAPDNARLQRHQAGGTEVDNLRTRQTGEVNTQGFTIMGFPWQFVVVMGAMIAAVLLLVVKATGLL